MIQNSMASVGTANVGDNMGQRQSAKSLLESMLNRRLNEIKNLSALKYALERLPSDFDIDGDAEACIWQLLISYDRKF